MSSSKTVEDCELWETIRKTDSSLNGSHSWDTEWLMWLRESGWSSGHLDMRTQCTVKSMNLTLRLNHWYVLISEVSWFQGVKVQQKYLVLMCPKPSASPVEDPLWGGVQDRRLLWDTQGSHWPPEPQYCKDGQSNRLYPIICMASWVPGN